ncbi:MAG: type II toxin-antitoxin system HicA family toxin [Candidatus Latescibacterota bacterium]
MTSHWPARRSETSSLPKLPTDLSGQEIVNALCKQGFTFVRQKGSHAVLRKPTPTGHTICVVPMHGQVAAGTLTGILKQAGLDRDAFLESL